MKNQNDKLLNKEINRRRTFAIISHPDAGKTTLTEKMLLVGGAIQLAGSGKARKAGRPKATYDLPLALIEKIQEIASREDVSQSDIVAWALVEFLERYEAGEVVLQEHKTSARSLRFACKLDLPERWR